jgi:hypothetical protein
MEGYLFDADVWIGSKSTKHQQVKPGMTVSASRRMFSRAPWPAGACQQRKSLRSSGGAIDFT